MSPRELPAEVGVKALTRDELAAALAELDEPPYRTAQLVKWLYQRGASSYGVMSDLPAGLRERLANRLALPFPEVIQRQVSSDGTRKYLLKLAGGTTVETVGLPTADRLTVCYSTQAGCAMGCTFCATGSSGFTRNLGPGEMVDQLTVVERDFGRRVTNAVAMGQGEPFANYDNVLAALRFMNAKDGLGVGARHLTVSTCGILLGIRRFAEEAEQFTLAVSLHSAVQKTRDQLMPGVRATPLASLREALIEYAEKTGRRPSLEYALVEGVNDSDSELAALVDYCRGLLVHVNLIPVNPVDALGLTRPAMERVRVFEHTLAASGTQASIRAERGTDIDAACGQLRQRLGGD